jgi:hypothetical protein
MCAFTKHFMCRALILVLALGGFTVSAFAQLPVVDPPRAWKTSAGAPFQATLLSFDGTTAIFKMPNGQRVPAPADKLSAEDQAYLAEWVKKQPLQFTMPEVVGVDTSAIKTEVVGEDAKGEKFVYRTTNFEFESQGKFTQSLLREIARNFEATYELLKVLPWNIAPRPPSGTHFKARLFKSKAAYAAAGGPPNSAGFYSSKDECFFVPFQSIGIKESGKSYTKDDDFDSSTLVHELTHQMMHFWLDALPQWILEGTAEYTSNLPLKTGKFRVSSAKTGLKEYVDFLKRRVVGGVPEPFPLEKLFIISNEEWGATLAADPATSRRAYFTSYLLVYYFMHMDGKGDGQRFIRYFREVAETKYAMEKYCSAVEEFRKKPEVKDLGDGRYSWPSNLKHPNKPVDIDSPEAQKAFQIKTLKILLDGRSVEQLLKEIRAAYKKLGITL